MPEQIQRTPSSLKTQRFCARLSGFLFLWLIATGIAGLIVESHVAGSGTFAETAKNVIAQEHLYRFGIGIELVETMSALLLAVALYVTLKPANKLLAQLAMYWRLGESFLGGVGVMFAFARLHLYESAPSLAHSAAGQSQLDLAETITDAFNGSNISAIFFSIGSILFFYVFYQSGYIPRALSAFGVFASAVVTLMLFGMLLFPEYAGPLQYGWAPMALAELATGIWLLASDIKLPTPNSLQPSIPAHIAE